MTALTLRRLRGNGARPHPLPLYCALVAGAVVGVVLAVATGVVDLPLSHVLRTLWPLGDTDSGNVMAQAVVLELRLPRALMALLVGACLASAGAALQGLFGNPLADPGIVGVSSGASVGAVIVIVLQLDVLGSWTLPAGAFATGMATTWIIYLLARPGPHTGSAVLLLVGIAINAVAGAITGYFTYLASTEQLESLMFWSMGSLQGITWTEVLIIAPVALVGITLLRRHAVELDLLALGERPARHAGVDVRHLRRWLIFLTALLVAAGVAFTGAIAFIGLVVPHVVRLMMGPSHRHLLPMSALGGGLLLMLADIAARSLDPPNEIPIGILTATLGGPFFLWLVARDGRIRAQA